MPTLQELLDDASITDELEINFGDKGKFKVGDLRGQRKAMSAKEKEIADTLTAAVNARATAEALAKEAEKLLAGAREPKVTPKEGELDFDTDPIYGPMMSKVIKPLRETNTKLEQALAALSNNYNEMAKIGLTDRYERRWGSVPEEKRKGKNWREYLKRANDSKVFDELGLPDPVKVLMDEIAPTELAGVVTERDTLKAKVDELTKQLESAPRMPRPGGTGAPKNISKDDKVFNSTDDLIDAAFSDPVIQGVIGNG